MRRRRPPRSRACSGSCGEGDLGPFPGAQHLALAALPGLEGAAVEHARARWSSAPAASSRWAYSTVRSSRRRPARARLRSSRASRCRSPARRSRLRELVALDTEPGVAGRERRGRARRPPRRPPDRPRWLNAATARLRQTTGSVGSSSPSARQAATASAAPVVGVAASGRAGRAAVGVVRVGATRGQQRGASSSRAGKFQVGVGRAGPLAGRRAAVVLAEPRPGRGRGGSRASGPQAVCPSGAVGVVGCAARSSSRRARPVRRLRRTRARRPGASGRHAQSTPAEPRGVEAHQSSGSRASVSAERGRPASVRPSRRSSITRSLRACRCSGSSAQRGLEPGEGRLGRGAGGVEARQPVARQRPATASSRWPWRTRRTPRRRRPCRTSVRPSG